MIRVIHVLSHSVQLKNKMKKTARFTIYNLLGTFDTLLGRQNKIVVYCYHNITSNPWPFHISAQKFAKQMKYLASTGTFVSLQDIDAYLCGKKQLPKNSFAITFDDGYQGIKAALPITERLGIKPGVFMLPSKNMVDRSEIVTRSELLTATDAKALTKAGWNMGLHGLTHKKLTKLPKQQMQKEVHRPKDISYFAYPHGKYNSEVVLEIKKQNYKLAFSMNDELITRNTDRFAVPRVGVMGDHTDSEFKYLASPSVLAFRRVVKNTFLRRYI